MDGVTLKITSNGVVIKSTSFRGGYMFTPLTHRAQQIIKELSVSTNSVVAASIFLCRAKDAWQRIWKNFIIGCS